jgi:hypothetical protein
MVWRSLSYGAATLTFAGLISALRKMDWRPREPEERAHCYTLGLSVLSTVLLTPRAYAAVSRRSGIPHLGKLLIDCASLAGTWTFLPVVNRLRGGPRPRSSRLDSGWLATAASGTLVLLFRRTNTRSPDRPDMAGWYFDAPPSLPYTLMMLGYLMLMHGRTLWVAWPLANAVEEPRARRHARVQASAWACTVAAMAHECLYAVVTHKGGRYGRGMIAAIRAIFFACLMLTLFSPVLFDLLAWCQNYVAHRQLYRLRRLLDQNREGESFLPAPAPLVDWLTFDELPLRVEQRAIGIHEGMADLRPYADPAVATRAAKRCDAMSITGVDAEAICTAAVLIDAARRRALGRTLDHPAESAMPWDDRAPGSPEEDLRYLLRVGRACRSSLVRQFVAATSLPAHTEDRGKVAAA